MLGIDLTQGTMFCIEYERDGTLHKEVRWSSDEALRHYDGDRLKAIEARFEATGATIVAMHRIELSAICCLP